MKNNIEKPRKARRAGRRVRPMEKIHLEEILRQPHDHLTEGEIEALKFWLGLTDGFTHTLRDTAAKYGTTVRNVKQAEKKLFGKPLRLLSEEELLGIIRKMFEDPQWAEKLLAEYEEG